MTNSLLILTNSYANIIKIVIMWFYKFLSHQFLLILIDTHESITKN